VIEQLCSGYKRSTLVEELDHLPEFVGHHFYFGEKVYVKGSQGTCPSCEACYEIETNYIIKKLDV